MAKLTCTENEYYEDGNKITIPIINFFDFASTIFAVLPIFLRQASHGARC